MTGTTDYLRKAADDAGETVRNFADEILEALLDIGEASDDLLNDYPNGDAYHHEPHVDKWYDFADAAAVIGELADFEETDSGLWHGQDMKTAVATCAAYTYGNAVYDEWRKKIEQINEEGSEIIGDYNRQIGDNDDADAEAERLEEEAAGLEADANRIESDDTGMAGNFRKEAANRRTDAAKERIHPDRAALEEAKKDALRELIDDVANRP